MSSILFSVRRVLFWADGFQIVAGKLTVNKWQFALHIELIHRMCHLFPVLMSFCPASEGLVREVKLEEKLGDTYSPVHLSIPILCHIKYSF